MDNLNTEDYTLENSTVKLTRVHNHNDCVLSICPVHHKTDHPMRSYPQGWNLRNRVMTRVCPHGMHHIDPDDPFVTTTGLTYQQVEKLICMGEAHDDCCGVMLSSAPEIEIVLQN